MLATVTVSFFSISDTPDDCTPASSRRHLAAKHAVAHAADGYVCSTMFAAPLFSLIAVFFA